jgi:hypothetical protein
VTSDRDVEGDRGGRVVVGWVLAQALVRAVVIEMALLSLIERDHEPPRVRPRAGTQQVTATRRRPSMPASSLSRTPLADQSNPPR